MVTFILFSYVWTKRPRAEHEPCT